LNFTTVHFSTFPNIPQIGKESVVVKNVVTTLEREVVVGRGYFHEPKPLD